VNDPVVVGVDVTMAEPDIINAFWLPLTVNWLDPVLYDRLDSICFSLTLAILVEFAY
jgi:hypothetical protein